MYGTLEQLDDGDWQLRFKRSLPHPSERVWQAISEPEYLVHWFPTTIEGERVAGASLRFSFPEGQAPPFEGEMIAYEPPVLMQIRWGMDILRIELRPAGDATVLTLLDRLDEHGKAARDAAGWHTCLDALAAHLQEAPTDRESMNGWKTVHRHYVEDFGPDASTIGPPKGFE
jgi:uncharacterized protein YndB with AHSA1/START domain